MLDLHWVMWSLYFPHGKYICAIWWHGAFIYINGDSYGHPLCSTYSRLISILLREGFYVNPQKSKRFDRIDKLNYTPRYLDDIFTIDNLAFSEHIPDIYPRKNQLNKASVRHTLQPQTICLKRYYQCFSSLSQFEVDYVGDWSAISQGPVGDQLQRFAGLLQNLVATHLRPSCDCDEYFCRGEVAEYVWLMIWKCF